MRASAGQIAADRRARFCSTASRSTAISTTLKRFVAYIPQDDAFDDHLTIEENLQFAAAIRSPHLSARDRSRRIEGKLVELGLDERRDSVVGSPVKKTAHRRRAETTEYRPRYDRHRGRFPFRRADQRSVLEGLASTSIEIIRSMAHNKIVLVTIHQPTSKLFQMFHKAMLLDKGGSWSSSARLTRCCDTSPKPSTNSISAPNSAAAPPAAPRGRNSFSTCSRRRCAISAATSFTRRTIADNSSPARRFSPEYWRDKYESFRLLQDVKQVSLKREPVPTPPSAPQKKRTQIRWHDEWTQFYTLMRRAFISKLRNRGNLRITIGAAPLLAFLIGTLLRYSDSGTYDFASAFHIPMYLFLGLLVAMFLSLTNSVDDIVSDRPVLQRERNLNIRLSYYVLAKIASLSVFALVQCMLFVLIGNYILEVRGMFWIHLGLMFLTAVSSLALGLLVSSLVADAKSAANIVPLILIPQILMSGALLKFEDMNRNPAFVYLMARWFSEHPTTDKSKKMDSKLEVPFACQFIGMRWSYEELVVAQAKLNPLTRRQERVNGEIQQLAPMAKTPEATARLNELKEVLAILSGLEAKSPKELDDYFDLIDDVIAGKKPFRRAAFKDAVGPVTAEQLYINQKVSDLISNAEMEQNDYRRGGKPNVFFGAEKSYLGAKVGVFTFNTCVLIGSTVALLGLLLWILRRQLEVRRG